LKLLDLPNDITSMLANGHGPKGPSHAYGQELAEAYGKAVVKAAKGRERAPNTLYFSEVGMPCMRKLWYSVNQPELAPAIDGNLRLKFMYGDILESLVLQLAEDSGHTVSDKQKEVEYDVGNGWRIRGRIDSVIDGVLVDVKSTTKQGESKFADLSLNDPFGYYGQLNGYATALKYEEAAFVTIQKELGHVKVFPIKVDPAAFREQATLATTTVAGGLPTARLAPVFQSSTSPNKKLCTTCSYCSFNTQCWSDANGGRGIRKFLYSSKVEQLVEVVNEPKVPELFVSGGADEA
jgi:hypothetical protein